MVDRFPRLSTGSHRTHTVETLPLCGGRDEVSDGGPGRPPGSPDSEIVRTQSRSGPWGNRSPVESYDTSEEPFNQGLSKTTSRSQCDVNKCIDVLLLYLLLLLIGNLF